MASLFYLPRNDNLKASQNFLNLYHANMSFKIGNEKNE